SDDADELQRRVGDRLKDAQNDGVRLLAEEEGQEIAPDQRVDEGGEDKIWDMEIPVCEEALADGHRDYRLTIQVSVVAERKGGAQGPAHPVSSRCVRLPLVGRQHRILIADDRVAARPPRGVDHVLDLLGWLRSELRDDPDRQEAGGEAEDGG